MRLAGLILAGLMAATTAAAPVIAQDKILREPDPPPPSIKERAFLHEEDPNDPARRLAGSVTWASETLTSNYGAKERAIIGRTEFPDRRMSMVLTLRHNTDRSVPATHTLDLYFMPEDPHSSFVLNVPGVWMKQDANAHGTPLAGLTVKITSGFFLIGLSEAPTDRNSNLVMLKERPWFEIPMVFTSGQRAMLALEKGATGNATFARTFAEWEK